jgi:hypothetical protein
VLLPPGSGTSSVLFEQAAATSAAAAHTPTRPYPQSRSVPSLLPALVLSQSLELTVDLSSVGLESGSRAGFRGSPWRRCSSTTLSRTAGGDAAANAGLVARPRVKPPRRAPSAHKKRPVYDPEMRETRAETSIAEQFRGGGELLLTLEEIEADRGAHGDAALRSARRSVERRRL